MKLNETHGVKGFKKLVMSWKQRAK